LTAALRVVLADDHLILRQALRALLERNGLRVVADVADGRAAVEAVDRLAPDVVVLDVAMPLLNGIDAAREIMHIKPHPHVILLSALDDPRFVPEALRIGVRGFVLKTQGAEDLFRAIEEVQRGALYVSPGAAQDMIDACEAAGTPGTPGTPPAERLSPRERQVVQLVAEGKSTKGIAQALRISVKTAEFHRGRVMHKLSIHDTAGLVRYAIREGLITA
jgi:two-component system response regulator NreC